jgi:hypothetical protein
MTPGVVLSTVLALAVCGCAEERSCTVDADVQAVAGGSRTPR